ncbi:MAG: methyltransferase [Planctomycetota bacterium]
MPPTAPSPAPIFNLLQGFHASGVLNAAIQLGVFGALAKGPRAAAQVAAAVRCPERSAAILCDALASTGLLHKESRRYRLSLDAAQFLVPGRPGYVGGAARILCDPALWDAFGRFAQAVRHGGTVLPFHAETPGQRFWETFADNSDAFAAPAAGYSESLLKRFLEDRAPSKVLDVACGSGLYGLTVAGHCPGAHVTLLDGAHVVPSVKKRARELGLSKRVTCVGGDMFRTDLGGPYDAIIASHVLHHFSPGTCETLLKRFALALVPGGRLLVHEFVAAEDGVSNAHAAMFAAVMLAWTREGRTYSFSEYTRMFTKTGFSEPVLHAPPHLMSQFLVGERKVARRPKKK